MKIDLEHIHYWMCAIRESKDPQRTLDAFWKGQLNSKEWLITKIRPWALREFGARSVSIDIHGGWVGVLSSLLFQSDLPVSKIRSVDIDPFCESISRMMNKKEEMEGRFSAITSDMCNIDINYDIVINTSCEHISQQQYDLWLDKVPESSLIVLQSNNYIIPEHIRIASDLNNFIQQSKLTSIIYSGELELPLYTRFMIIGKKHV